MNDQIAYYQSKLAFEMDSWDLLKGLENGEDIVPVDTRQPAGFDKEHIPGAINIPHRTMNETNTAHLDKSKLYVCYCDGSGCNASTKRALNLTRFGFKVKELIGGIESWKFDGYATEGTKASTGNKINCDC